MGRIARRVAAGLRGGVFIGQAGEHAGIEVIRAAHAMRNRAGRSRGRAGLGGICANIKRSVVVGGGVSERIDLLIYLSRVIPVSMAGNEAVRGVQPAADSALIAANAIRRRSMLRANACGGEVWRL